MNEDEKRDLLLHAGEALFGRGWQTPTAEALGVTDRTVRRWISGESPIPAGVWSDIHRLTLERAADLDALDEPLKRAGAP